MYFIHVENVSNSLDPAETPDYSASHPDPNCVYYDTMVALSPLNYSSLNEMMEYSNTTVWAIPTFEFWEILLIVLCFPKKNIYIFKYMQFRP